MPYSFESLADNASPTTGPLDAAGFTQRVERLLESDGPRFARLWNYYRNPQLSASASVDASAAGASIRPYRLAQEWGLPPRITGVRSSASGSSNLSGDSLYGVARKEVVVENDIAWRIDTMVDYLFGKPPTIRSSASDPVRAAAIETLINTVLDLHGGTVFLQHLAVLGAVYGFVDVLVKLDVETAASIAKEVNLTTSILKNPGLKPRASSLGSSETSELLPTPDGAAPSQREPSDSEPISVPSDVPAPPPAAPALSLPEISDTASAVESASPLAASEVAALVPNDAMLIRIAGCIRLEIVEPARALPLLSPSDWREVEAYAQVYSIERPATAKPAIARMANRINRSWISRLLGTSSSDAVSRSGAHASSDKVRVTEIITDNRWARFEDEVLVASGENSLGELPLAHIQNIAVPFEHAGASDVEPLMPLQDELNTRLSDRAHRITMQSFKMYLGKGIENFGNLPVAPGQMWMTDNDNADIVEFGGDASSPSEASHISEIREAMDKTSAVTPIAAGILRDRIGNLSSGAALRVTLSALLAKTERKRTTYGAGIRRIAELTLAWLDRGGLFATDASERRFEIRWPEASPDDTSNRLADAEAKLRLGIDRKVVLTELGYAED